MFICPFVTIVKSGYMLKRRLSHLAKHLVPENDREHFLKIAKEEIAALHEGNVARYRLRPGEFKDWQKRKT